MLIKRRHQSLSQVLGLASTVFMVGVFMAYYLLSFPLFLQQFTFYSVMAGIGELLVFFPRQYIDGAGRPLLAFKVCFFCFVLFFLASAGEFLFLGQNTILTFSLCALAVGSLLMMVCIVIDDTRLQKNRY